MCRGIATTTNTVMAATIATAAMITPIRPPVESATGVDEEAVGAAELTAIIGCAALLTTRPTSARATVAGASPVVGSVTVAEASAPCRYVAIAELAAPTLMVTIVLPMPRAGGLLKIGTPGRAAPGGVY